MQNTSYHNLKLIFNDFMFGKHNKIVYKKFEQCLNTMFLHCQNKSFKNTPTTLYNMIRPIYHVIYIDGV
jgi:hypothetical protein